MYTTVAVRVHTDYSKRVGMGHPSKGGPKGWETGEPKNRLV